MHAKKEISIRKKDAKIVLLLILAPIILTFIIQHFGEFKFKGYGSNPIDYRVTETIFKTPFGNEVRTNEIDGYEQHSGGEFRIKGYYTDRLPFYLKGTTQDSLFTIIFILILLAGYTVRKKITIRFS